MELREKIANILESPGFRRKTSDQINDLIELVLIPLAKEAFEAGESNSEIYADRGGYTFIEHKDGAFDEWIKEKFKV